MVPQNASWAELLEKCYGDKAKKVTRYAIKKEMDIFDVERTVDGIFLCSDGLTNMLTKEQIEKVLNDDELDIEEKVSKLIMKANSRGGTDNITIAYARMSGE